MADNITCDRIMSYNTIFFKLKLDIKNDTNYEEFLDYFKKISKYENKFSIFDFIYKNWINIFKFKEKYYDLKNDYTITSKYINNTLYLKFDNYITERSKQLFLEHCRFINDIDYKFMEHFGPNFVEKYLDFRICDLDKWLEYNFFGSYNILNNLISDNIVNDIEVCYNNFNSEQINFDQYVYFFNNKIENGRVSSTKHDWHYSDNNFIAFNLNNSKFYILYDSMTYKKKLDNMYYDFKLPEKFQNNPFIDWKYDNVVELLNTISPNKYDIEELFLKGYIFDYRDRIYNYYFNIVD